MKLSCNSRLRNATPVLFLFITILALSGCSSSGIDSSRDSGPKSSLSKAVTTERVELPLIVSSKAREAIPKGTRIVISHIEDKKRIDDTKEENEVGECADAVRDALLVRLADNTDYIVLARDDLKSMFFETDLQWSGKINTQTSVRLGELLGASVFVVGRVAYCGQSIGTEAGDKFGDQYSISVILQIIDLKTGRVILSSASEGIYDPGPNSFLQDLLPGVDSSSWQTAIRDLARTGISSYAASQKSNRISPFFDNPASADPVTELFSPQEQEDGKAKARYAIIEAAKDMANQFSDKFFARPSWERVFMWRSEWDFGESVRLVQLGYCSRAVDLFEGPARNELSLMTDTEVAHYLHNYGVALLCANRPDDAFEKLRAAYRVEQSQTTLEMIGLAAKLIEWDLHVESNDQPEVELLAQRRSERPTIRITEEPIRETAVPEVEILQRDVGETGEKE